MSKKPSHERDTQILDLLDGSLPVEEQAELRDWLDVSPQHYDRFVELSFIHSQLAEQLASMRSADDVRLESLQSVVQRSETELPPTPIDANALTKEKYASALAYVIKHTFTPKRVAMLASAAAVLLGVVLAVQLLTGPDTNGPITQQPGNLIEPDRVTPQVDVTPYIVGTLSDEYDAVWDRRPGQDLFAGQRFELIEGLAEITTNRGAVAILEAPATIELVNSDNALFLHSGRLFGVCETEASQGFLVRTPHVVVNDLGTRFRVDANDPGRTAVHVIEGSVLATLLRSGQAIELSKGQAVTAATGDASFVRMDAEPGRWQTPQQAKGRRRFGPRRDSVPRRGTPRHHAGRSGK